MLFPTFELKHEFYPYQYTHVTINFVKLFNNFVIFCYVIFVHNTRILSQKQRNFVNV